MELCGTHVRRLYFKAFRKPRADERTIDGEPFSTVAFFGLTSRDGALWACGIDGIYTITADGAAAVTPFPKFQNVGGVYLSFEVPGFAVILTSINRRRSVSGAAPMLVPLS